MTDNPSHGDPSPQQQVSKTGKVCTASAAIRRYCRRTLAAVGIGLGGIAALNFTVDPYWIHRGPLSTYWRPNERQISSRITKAELAIQEPIGFAILGDSRTLWGMDPRHEALEGFGTPFNLGMVGASVYETSRMLDLLLNKPEPPKAILWLMPIEFVVIDRRPQQNFDYSLSRLNPNHTEYERFLDSLWGKHTTQKSFSYLLPRRMKYKPIIVHGYAEQLDRARPLEWFESAAHHSMQFIATAEEEDDIPEAQTLLNRQLGECARRGIKVDIAIPPSHASHWLNLENQGLGRRVIAGKQLLCQVARTANQSVGSSDLIRVWDFSGFSGPSTEAPPAPTETKSMVYYMDAVHFSRRLGRMMINRVHGRMNDADDFGVELTAENLESHLARWKSDCEKFANKGNAKSNVRFAAESAPKVY